MNYLQRLNTGIEKLFMFVSVILLIALSAIVFMQIVFRNVLQMPMMWSIETSLFCFFWAVFLGAAVGLRYRRHYTVEIFPENYVKANLVLEIISHFIVLVIVYIFIFNGYAFAKLAFAKLSTTISMPQGYFYLSMPISGVAMALFSIELLAMDIKKMFRITQGKGG